MLAEPRRKVKYGANPRGNEWVNDGSKFGQRMLEKMGWSKGKGLGAKEDGVTEHVRLGFRIGNEGLGWQEKDNNPELNASYEQALADLQQRHASAFPLQAPVAAVKRQEESATEAASQPVLKRPIIVRHRYAKVLRAKDTSCYSKEDMVKIFAVRMDDDASPAAAAPFHAPQSLGQEWRVPDPSQEAESRSRPEQELDHEQDGERRRQKKSKKRKRQERAEEASAAPAAAEEPDCETRSKKRSKNRNDETRVEIEPEDSCDPSPIPPHADPAHDGDEDGPAVRRHEKKRRKDQKKGSKRARTEQPENLESEAGDAAAAAAGEEEASD